MFEIVQTLKIALFIIVYRLAWVEIESSSNTSNQLKCMQYFDYSYHFWQAKRKHKQKQFNISWDGRVIKCEVEKLHSEKMKKYQGNVDFNIQCPRVKKMNWHGNNRKVS